MLTEPNKKRSIQENIKHEALSLEEIVHKANEVGLLFVEKKREMERMDILKSTIRARIMNRLDDGNFSEAKLRRLSETEPTYIEHLEKIVNCRYETEKLKIRYDSYKNLFEAKRSELSYKKAEMRLF